MNELKRIGFFTRTRLTWVVLCLLALLLRSLATPEWVERWYSRGLFQGVRYLFYALTGWLPMPAVYLLFAGLVTTAIWQTRLLWRNPLPWRRKLVRALGGWLAFVAGVVFLFLLLWGFNYGRIPLETTLGIQPKPLTDNELQTELDRQTAYVLQLRAALPGATDSALTAAQLPPNLDNQVYTDLSQVLRQAGYPVPGRVQARLLHPEGTLLRLSAAGIYIPFCGEGYVDAGRHPVQMPFDLAHEMSHGYGFGDEGSCNFLAWLACEQSDNAFFRYSGALGYWRYLAADYRAAVPPDVYRAFEQQLPAGLRHDLRAIQQFNNRYPEFFPDFSDAAYTSYLHAQGIAEGLRNYNRLVLLVNGWHNRPH